MTAVLEKTSFQLELEESRRPQHSGMHPFSAAWTSGELSRKQLGEWAKQHYYYIETVGQMFGMLYVRLPDVDARLHTLDNLMGEELMGDRHPDLLLRFAEACGLSRQEVLNADLNGEILAGTRGLRAWTLELGQFRPVAESAAGIMVGLEGQLPAMYSGYVEAMHKMGFTKDELKFFYVHIEGDEEHAANGLAIAERYANTPELKERAKAAVRASTQMRYNYLSGIYRKFVLGEEVV